MTIEIVETSQQSIGRNVLLYPLLRQLQVAETINRMVSSEAEIPLGSVAEIIILSRFAKERVPMYQLHTFCAKNGLDTLYQIDALMLNDDRVGRCLDAMHPHLCDLKTALILRGIKTFDLTVNQIHTDITNILFEGRYLDLDAGDLNVTWGHTKKGQDSRCKQVNFSLSVTADGGVPLFYQALDGNTSDSVCYTPHLDAFQAELGITKPLVVGDSKLVSHNNMMAFCRAGAIFIGPATLDKTLKKRLLRLWEQGVGFSALSFKAEDKKPIPYWGLETERDISDKKTKEKYRIRLVYIFSHQRRQVIRHTRAKNFLKAKAALHKINRCLNKYDYKTERIILARLQSQVLRKCPYYRYELHKDSDGLFSIAYWIDWQQLADDEMFDGIYVLKTNAPKAWFSMNVILETYKGQPHVERCFETVKQPPICVSPVWLHKAQRIESLLFLVFLALLVISLLQREGRQKVWPKRTPLRPERRDHLPLTAAVLLAAFDTVAITTVTVGVDGRLWTDIRCTRLSDSQRRVLFALAFPTPSHYLQPSGGLSPPCGPGLEVDFDRIAG